MTGLLLGRQFTRRYITLTSEQRQLVDSITRFCQHHLNPDVARKIDQSNTFPTSLWKGLGTLGVLGITAPTTHGGLSSTYTSHCLAMETLSLRSPSVGLSYGAHSNLCINQIVRNCNQAQKSAYLPKLISGEWVGALAMSEAEAGSDVMSMKTTAERKGNVFILKGSKMWVTNGPDANVVIVYAKTDSSAKPSKQLSAFLVEGKWITSRGPKLVKMGMRGSNTCELHFDSVRIPETALIGKEGDGARILMSGLDYERLILSAGPLGIMQACLNNVLPYVHTRKQFGKSIGEFQLIQGKVADMYCKLSASRALTYSIAHRADTQDKHQDSVSEVSSFRADCAAAILYSAERAVEVALDAIQCFGGNGYTEEYPLSRLLRDAKLYEIGAGTSEIRRMLIARELGESFDNM